MSIDPLKNALLPPQTTRSLQGQTGTDSNATFARMLDSVEQGKADVAGVQALMQLAQVQLLQGLFGDDDGPETDGFLASMQPQAFSLSGQHEVRQADRIYQQLQPSLQKPAGRSEIEAMIDQVAQQVSLAPELIRSVVAAESDFQPQAVSPVGAQGLMQLMPETAAELGVQDSFDPQQNLLGGSRYLKQLLDKYSGDLDKALAAYNWGQGNVDRKGLQQMPQETRSYLAKVKGMLTADV